ncbi:MAG: hypothetical protein R3F33_10705 [Planctomycetota bacterium]
MRTERPENDLPLAIVAALEGELRPLVARAYRVESPGPEPRWRLPEGPMLVCTGVGKVAAAAATARLLAEGVRGILMVGTGGGIGHGLTPGDMICAEGWAQWDLGVRMGREGACHGPWVQAWAQSAGARRGLILSGDRGVFDPWSRRKLRRAWPEALLVDMEVAAVGAVCAAAGIPFAALKTVSDLAGVGAKKRFAQEFAETGGRAAASLLVWNDASSKDSWRRAFPIPDVPGPISG